MQPGSLEKLIEYQDSLSDRKYIIDSLNYFKFSKAMNYSEMLYYTSINPEYELDEIIDSLENETDIQLKLLLADLYMGKEQYEEAEEIYNNLPVYDRETELMIALRTIQIDLLEDGKTWFDIGTEGYPYMDDLEEIAFGDTTVASFQAMTILSLINDTLYDLPFQDKEESSPKMSPIDSNEKNRMTENAELYQNYMLYPTLINGDIYGKIILEEDESGNLVLYSIQGNPIGNFKIQEGMNEIPLKDLNMPSGIYLYRVFVNGELKNTSKIVKIK